MCDLRTEGLMARELFDVVMEVLSGDQVTLTATPPWQAWLCSSCRPDQNFGAQQSTNVTGTCRCTSERAEAMAAPLDNDVGDFPQPLVQRLLTP